MDAAVSLLGIGALIGVWIVISKKLKQRPLLIRHSLGVVGGVFSLLAVVALGLATGAIENTEQSAQPDTATNGAANVAREPNEPEERPSFRQMMNDRNEYSEEAGTLIIKSESPLEVTLYTTDAIKQSDEIKTEDMRKAVLYGIYRTFIHTNEPEITVTAHPLDIKSFNPYEAEKNHTLKVSVSVTREQAFEAVQRLIPDTTSFDDLTTVKTVGGLTLEDEWTDAFGKLYWNAEGQIKLLDALRSAASQ